MLSSSLLCLGCYAAFDYSGESADLGGQVCSFCGSDLMEMPDPGTSELEGCGLQMIRPPLGEMELRFAKRQDPDLVPKLALEDSVVIRRQDLAAVIGDVDIHVKVWPSAGHKSPTITRWGASLLELDVDHSDIDLDATLVGLTEQVSARVTQLLGQDDERRESHLPLLLRLWLEDQAGRLGTFLESAAVLVNWESEHDAC